MVARQSDYLNALRTLARMYKNKPAVGFELISAVLENRYAVRFVRVVAAVRLELLDVATGKPIELPPVLGELAADLGEQLAAATLREDGTR